MRGCASFKGKILTFRHNDADDLVEILHAKETRRQGIVMTEGTGMMETELL